jgi:hypothetical protein
LINGLPERRAQRARQPPFVRTAAPLPSGLSLRMPGLHPKRRLSGARCVPQEQGEASPLGHIGADVRGTCSSTGSSLVPTGKSAGRHFAARR